jgi:hypothetical protein
VGHYKAVFNSWDKNDPKDAQVILRLLKQGMTQRYCDPLVLNTHDLQELSKTYEHVSKARTRLQHLLLTLYRTLYFPEMERFWTCQRNEWFIRLLLNFPTLASIASISVEEFRERIWSSMGRRFISLPRSRRSTLWPRAASPCRSRLTPSP